MSIEYGPGPRASRPGWLHRLAVMLIWFIALALLAYFWQWGWIFYLDFLFKPLWGD